MNKLEKMEQEVQDNNIEVYDTNFSGTRIKGLYVDGNIALAKGLSTTEKACVLAEELGHHHTTVGDIVDLSVVQNRKQERQARIWAYNKQIGLCGLIRAYESRCRDWHEVADYLEVTEEFLHEAVNCYTAKYGTGTTIDNYYIMFIPSLMVGKIIDVSI